MLGLLASCAQPVVDPVPAAPATLSSDLADAASDVATDAQGNAYVLGYRNQDVNRDINSGGVNLPAELFVGQFSKAGVLDWLTVLRTDQLDELRYASSVVATDTAVYALTQAEYLAPLYLHKLALGGTLLWSKVIAERATAVGDVYASPNGRLLVQYSAASGEDSLVSKVSALDARGTLQWSKMLPGELLGVGSDDGLYLADTLKLKLQKHDAAGAPLWSQDIAPDAPYTDDPYLGPFVSLMTGGTQVYTLVEFYLEGADASRGIGNVQIDRYTSSGEEVWSAFLYPVEGSLASTFSTFPVGVGSNGDLHLLVESENFDASGVEKTSTRRLHRFFADSGHTSVALKTASDDVEASSLIPGQVKDAFDLPQTAFYTVSTSGKNLGDCINSIDEDRPCAYTDVFTSLYTIDSASDKTSLYTHLQWSFR